MSVAYLLATNPETFEFFRNNKIDLYHGTNGKALNGIIQNGMSSFKEMRDKGIDVETGEKWSRNNENKRNFISFTDDLNTVSSYAYSKSSPEEAENEMNFGVVIGMSSKNLKNLEKTRVGSDLPEIGIMGNIPIEYIDSISVPKEKVEIVKKMVGNKQITVLPYDMDIPFYIDELETYIDFDKLSQRVSEAQKDRENTEKVPNKKMLTVKQIGKATIKALTEDKMKITEMFNRLKNLLKEKGIGK